MYTPEMIANGQHGACGKCGKPPITDTTTGREHEIYDGCIGKLSGDVMNACCGHGKDSCAYIQYGNGEIVRGMDAIKLMGMGREV